jgi:hypothetical protein
MSEKEVEEVKIALDESILTGILHSFPAFFKINKIRLGGLVSQSTFL